MSAKKQKKSLNPTAFTIGPDAEISDIDLDREEVFVDGRRLTERRAEALAREALSQLRAKNLVPGRKSLSHDGSHSPRVQFRVPQSVREDAQRRADQEGISLSTLARRALEQYLESNRSA